MNLNIKHIIQFLLTNVLCSLLFVKNLIFAKKLTVKNFIYTNKVIIRGNETEFNWKISGCHKILIKDLGILPGNTSSAHLTAKNKINPVEIIFYGVGGQKEIKKIEIETSSPSVLRSFSPKSSITSLNSIPLAKKDLKRFLVSSFNFQEPKSVKLNNPNIIPQNLKTNFEPFIKTNYPIKS